jgi:hypothetical protein
MSTIKENGRQWILNLCKIRLSWMGCTNTLVSWPRASKTNHAETVLIGNRLFAEKNITWPINFILHGHSNKLKVYYLISTAQKAWKQEKGHKMFSWLRCDRQRNHVTNLTIVNIPDMQKDWKQLGLLTKNKVMWLIMWAVMNTSYQSKYWKAGRPSNCSV